MVRPGDPGLGGEIWVESKLGMRTTFWLALPVAQRKVTGLIKRQTGRLVVKAN